RMCLERFTSKIVNRSTSTFGYTYEPVILRACDFFKTLPDSTWKITAMRDIWAYYAVMEELQGSVLNDVQPAVRLRQPQRNQMEMRVQCPDDLVAVDHPVRMVAAVVERLDVSKFYEAIKAREGLVGRDATDPKLLIGLWLYACIRGIGSARELA